MAENKNDAVKGQKQDPRNVWQKPKRAIRPPQPDQADSSRENPARRAKHVGNWLDYYG